MLHLLLDADPTAYAENRVAKDAAGIGRYAAPRRSSPSTDRPSARWPLCPTRMHRSDADLRRESRQAAAATPKPAAH